MSETLARVTNCITDVVGGDPDKILPSQSLINDLDFDSIDGLELAMMLEDEFDIEIPDADVESITTVQQLVDYVEGRLK